MRLLLLLLLEIELLRIFVIGNETVSNGMRGCGRVGSLPFGELEQPNAKSRFWSTKNSNFGLKKKKFLGFG